MIRHLVALSTAAACSRRPRVRSHAAAPAAPAHPNLSGSWVRPLGDRDVGGLPPVNEIPLTPWAAAKFKAERPAAGDNQNFADTTDPSLKYADPNGYPRISLHPMRFKLVQTDDYVYQLWEYNNNWRQIALNVPQDPDPALTWYGNPVGKWEGDTLVVDSVGYKDSTWLDARGLPHTTDLHLVERIHKVGENLAFDITFEDQGRVHQAVDGAIDLQAVAGWIDDGKHLHDLRRAPVPGALSESEGDHSHSTVISRANGGPT